MIKLLKRLLRLNPAKADAPREILTKEQVEEEKAQSFHIEIQRLNQLEDLASERNKCQLRGFYNSEIIEMNKKCPNRQNGKLHYSNGLEVSQPNFSSTNFISSSCVFCGREQTICLNSETKEFWEDFIDKIGEAT